MVSRPSTYYAQTVRSWIEQRSGGLSREELLDLFESAIQSERTLSLGTFSSFSLTAILERVHYETQKRYPFVAAMEITPEGVTVEKIRKQADKVSPQAISDAFDFFLTELLTLIGTLTGGILDNKLAHELLKVKDDRKVA